MSLLFITFVACLVIIGVIVYLISAVPKTRIGELNCLLSIDEDNLLVGKLVPGPKGLGALSDFTIFGGCVSYHYTSRYEGDAYIQIVNIVVFSTKARLCVTFKEGKLTYFEFEESWISVPEIYFREKELDELEGSQLFIAHRAPIIGQHIAPRRLREAQRI